MAKKQKVNVAAVISETGDVHKIGRVIKELCDCEFCCESRKLAKRIKNNSRKCLAKNGTDITS